MGGFPYTYHFSYYKRDQQQQEYLVAYGSIGVLNVNWGHLADLTKNDVMETYFKSSMLGRPDEPLISAGNKKGGKVGGKYTAKPGAVVDGYKTRDMLALI